MSGQSALLCFCGIYIHHTDRHFLRCIPFPSSERLGVSWISRSFELLPVALVADGLLNSSVGILAFYTSSVVGVGEIMVGMGVKIGIE